MKAERYLRGFIVAFVALGLSVPVVVAADATSTSGAQPATTMGTVVGVVRIASKAVIGGATVTIVRADGSGIRATVSGSDGLYSFPDLPSGSWSITTQADGYPDTETISLSVAAGKATRSDITLTASALASSTPQTDGKTSHDSIYRSAAYRGLRQATCGNSGGNSRARASGRARTGRSTREAHWARVAGRTFGSRSRPPGSR